MDILITELGSGGEVVIRNNDLVTINGLENQPYLAMFGGSDWWGNGLLVQGDAQFTSKTEDALKNNPLTSAGLIAIENAINDDLGDLGDLAGASVAADARITSKNRLDVSISIGGQIFYMQWSPDSSFLNYQLIE